MIGIVNKYYVVTSSVSAAAALLLGAYTNHKMDQAEPYLNNSAFTQAHDLHMKASDLERALSKQLDKRKYSHDALAPGFGDDAKETLDKADALRTQAYSFVPRVEYSRMNQEMESIGTGAGVGGVGTLGLAAFSGIYLFRALGRKRKPYPEMLRMPQRIERPKAETGTTVKVPRQE